MIENLREIFLTAHRIAAQIFQVWPPQENDPFADFCMGDHRGNCIQTEGRRTSQGYILEFVGYQPTALITPAGEWHFSGTATDDLHQRLLAFNDLSCRLNLDDHTEIPNTGEIFYVAVLDLVVESLPTPKVTDSRPKDSETETAWNRLTLEQLPALQASHTSPQ